MNMQESSFERTASVHVENKRVHCPDAVTVIICHDQAKFGGMMSDGSLDQ